MPVDPFSDILRLTEATTVVSGGFTAGGDWALRFPPPKNVKFSAVARGSCWVRVDGQKKGVLVDEGDVVLLPGRDGFVIGNSLATAPEDGYRALAKKVAGFARIGDGSDCAVISGVVSLHPSSSTLLMDVLPPLVHVRSVSPQAAPLRWIVEQIFHEHRSALPGSRVASAQLAQLLLVQVLRAHLASAGTLPAGWLRAISDERIAPAIKLMHGEPGRAWSLTQLARTAGMSRTSFAVRFKAVAGVGPLTYLTGWRMRLAQRMLRDQNATVSELADSLGYTSESAFSNAFKRVTGTAPRNYRNAARAQATALPAGGANF